MCKEKRRGGRDKGCFDFAHLVVMCMCVFGGDWCEYLCVGGHYVEEEAGGGIYDHGW